MIRFPHQVILCKTPEPKQCLFPAADAYILVEEELTWCQAQRYCRRRHTDLISIYNETENEEVLAEGKNRTFWIGLMHDEWQWEDGTCSTYRSWFWTPADHLSDYAYFDGNTECKLNQLSSRQSPLCSKGKQKAFAPLNGMVDCGRLCGLEVE